MYSGPAQGLWQTPNPFNQTPAGTLKKADNVRFTALGVIEPRRGFDYMASATFGSSSSLADAIAFYAGNILVAYDLTKVSLFTTSFTDFSGTFEPVGDNRMRFEGAARSIFFNTSQGLMCWDGVGFDDEPVVAGNPLGLNIVSVATYDDGWQTPDTAVAYRFTICSKDAFGRIVEGPPSGRLVTNNNIGTGIGLMSLTSNVVSGQPVPPGGLLLPEVGEVVTLLAPGETSFPIGAKTITSSAFGTFTYSETAANATAALNHTFVRGNATANDLTLYLPAEVTENNFVRVYRSWMTAHATDTPSDEMFQCYESGFLTSTDVSNGYVTIGDTAPEDTIDVPLYTNNNNGDGALQANYQPPRALDIVYWAQRMWFANTAQKDSLALSLIGVGSPDGIQAGDTLTFVFNGGMGDTIVLTAVNYGPTPGADEFVINDFYDPGLNIQLTAQDICRAFNAHGSPVNESAYAYYVSSEGGQPGSMLFVCTEFGSDFAAYSSRATAWTPQLPTLTTPPFPAPESKDDAHPAGLAWSKLGQPEAVPLVNKLLVNSDNDAIKRIFPLHYRLLIFKTDGIYTCSNLEPFTITKLSAYVLLAPDSVQVLEDRVYALTDQGIVTISDAGVVEISNPIDDIFNAMMAPTDIATLAERAVGISYRSERQALLWTPELEDDNSVTADNEQAFAFSTLAQGFTRYIKGVRCGGIDPDTNSLVIAPTDDNQLQIENKTLTDADYYDLSTSVGTASAISGADLTFSQAVVDAMTVGDVLASSAHDYYPITEIDGTTVTVSGAPGWTANTTTITRYNAIPCEVEFNKLTAGEPADLKMVGQVSFLFRSNGIHDTDATFSTEISPLAEEVELSNVGWGEFPWGGVPYGNPTQQIRRVEPLPENVAQCAQLSVGFITCQAMAKFSFLGIDVVEAEDTKVNRG